MKINQINGAVATLSTQNTVASERADSTRTAPSDRTPESSATWQSTVSSDNSQDIDTARVSQIREAIQSGDFKIDVEKIADGLIDETRRYLDQD